MMPRSSSSDIAFELLIERTPGNERVSTIIQQSIPKGRRNAFLKDMEEVFKKYIEDTTAQKRMMQQVRQAKATSDIDRWTDILDQSGVTLNPKEIKELRDARGAIVHSGDASPAGSLSPRLHEIVTNYLNKLLAPTKEDNESKK